MPDLNPAREGYATFRSHRTRFRVVGKSRSRRALLCIHNGPAFGNDYLAPLEEMHCTGREVVFYDQLGCGASDHPGAGADWSLQLFIDELRAVREAAGLTRCHVLGHGWGGILAIEYMLTQPAGVEGLILSSTLASIPQWRAELARLVDVLPEELRTPLRRHSDAGTLSSPPCRGMLEAFMRRHLCRISPWPDCLERSLESGNAFPEVRAAMLGENPLQPAGALADWDVTGRLDEIRCPTLVTSGRYDMITPPVAAALYQGIPGSEWVVFEHSAHMPHLEEPQRYLEVLDGFLDKAEEGARSRRA